MVEVALVLLVATLGALGLATGRWSVLLAPFFAVPGFYLGLDREWWGYGLGDGWQYAMFGIIVLAVVVTAAAVAVRRRVNRGRG